MKEFATVVRYNNVRAAIKLQFRDVDTFIHKDFRHREDIRYIKKTLDTRLSRDEMRDAGRSRPAERLHPSGDAVRRGVGGPVRGARHRDHQDRELGHHRLAAARADREDAEAGDRLDRRRVGAKTWTRW